MAFLYCETLGQKWVIYFINWVTVILICTLLYSDIALVEIDNKVTFSDTIHPVCLPDVKNSDRNHYLRDSVTIVGFGSKTGDDKVLLRQISQRVQHYNLCDSRYNVSYAGKKYEKVLSKEFPIGFDETLMCANSR